MFLLSLDKIKNENKIDKNGNFFDDDSDESEDNIMRIKNLKCKPTSSRDSPLYANEGNALQKKSSYFKEKR